jgi:transcriptional regulator with AAA-type ATPase domain
VTLFEPEDRSFAEQAMDLVTSNPFNPDWMKKQQKLLGPAARDLGDVYAWRPGWGLWGPTGAYPDEVNLGERISDLAWQAQRRLRDRAQADPQELALYELLALYRLYRKYGVAMDHYIDAAMRGRGEAADRAGRQPEAAAGAAVAELWRAFLPEHEELFRLPGHRLPLQHDPAHVFAGFFLFRRAFYLIFFNIIGNSRPIAELRGAVWESIVTHDLRGWAQSLYGRMRDFPTLITGPSGTGKELVAQAIGRSQYIAFDPKREAFAGDFLQAFHPVNLSALPPLLVEAELFGQVKGAFTGAVGDRTGRLEDCPEHGAVFLDEIGELTAEVQVKLLRVLQSRQFQRVGANKDLVFRGKILSATNRDLAAEMRAGRFREDFFYRLCADRITTPSLREQLQARREDLPVMVEFVCRRVAGEERAAALAREVVDWIEANLRDHPWPGNFRELEQCVRSYVLRKAYHPFKAERGQSGGAVSEACATLAEAVLRRKSSYERIERRLFRLVRAGTRTAKEAAALLGCDYRTLQARLKGNGR